jgi:hypothetical protein
MGDAAPISRVASWVEAPTVSAHSILKQSKRVRNVAVAARKIHPKPTGVTSEVARRPGCRVLPSFVGSIPVKNWLCLSEIKRSEHTLVAAWEDLVVEHPQQVEARRVLSLSVGQASAGHRGPLPNVNVAGLLN